MFEIRAKYCYEAPILQRASKWALNSGYFCNIQWLSRGKVRNRVFATHVKLALFLRVHQNCLENSKLILILLYMGDIFDALNHLNSQKQGGVVNTIESE